MNDLIHIVFGEELTVIITLFELQIEETEEAKVSWSVVTHQGYISFNQSGF